MAKFINKIGKTVKKVVKHPATWIVGGVTAAGAAAVGIAAVVSGHGDEMVEVACDVVDEVSEVTEEVAEAVVDTIE